MRRVILSSVLIASLSAGASPLFATAFPPPPASDSSLLSENFSVDADTAVPGTVLKAGRYVIRVVDHLADRSIIRVEKVDGKTLSTFLAVPNRGLTNAGGQGPVVWGGGSNHDKALRGYNFPGGYSVEFVYPKAEAVKIATTHSASVEAVDPASDNLPSKQKDLTNDDLRIVTLWTLSPTQVNGATAIAAQKYKAPAPAPEPVVARNEPPASLPAPTRLPAISSDRPRVAPKQVATAPKPAVPAPARRPIAAVLPHTASDLPLVMLAGLISLFGVVTLRTRSLFARD